MRSWENNATDTPDPVNTLPPCDADELADAIEWLLDQARPPTSVGQRWRRRAAAHLSRQLEDALRGEAPASARTAAAIVHFVGQELHEASGALTRAAEAMRARGMPSDARRAHEAAVRAGRVAADLVVQGGQPRPMIQHEGGSDDGTVSATSPRLAVDAGRRGSAALEHAND